MSHELTQRASGRYEMAYTGQTPWHGLGQTVVKGASIEEWATAAGMDWKVCRSRVRYGDGDHARIIEDKHVLFRSDTKDALGIVSASFKIVQPRDVLEFFRDLTTGAGFDIETAGTLFGGRRFWALASIGDACNVVPGDKVGGYLLLCTGADGTLATVGKFTTVRVVCNNTLSMSLQESGQARITHRTQFDPVAMKDKLGIAHQEFSQFAENMKRLSDKSVSMARAERLAFDLLKPADFDKQPQAKQVETIEAVSDSAGFKKVLALFDGGGIGAKMDGVAGTAWGFVNAVTQYADHEVRAQSQDNRLSSAWFGPGDAMKSRAVELCMALK